MKTDTRSKLNPENYDLIYSQTFSKLRMAAATTPCLSSLGQKSVGIVSDRYNTSTIWMSGVYEDKVLIDDEHFMIVNYEGQNMHRDDRYIMVGSYFFIKQGGNYKFVGNVSSWKQTLVSETHGVPHKYQLVIMKKEPRYFRKKSDALMAFGLLGGSISSGIIPHKLVK